MALSSKWILPAVVGILAPIVLSACGGAGLGEAATPEQDSLASELEQRASDLDAELARLEQEKDRGQGKGTKTVDAGATVDAAPTAGEPADLAQAASTEEAPAPEQPSKRDRRRTACRALGSMQRSSERICSLVGERHEKCTWARSQVEEARDRVARAGCSCDPI